MMKITHEQLEAFSLTHGEGFVTGLINLGQLWVPGDYLDIDDEKYAAAVAAPSTVRGSFSRRQFEKTLFKSKHEVANTEDMRPRFKPTFEEHAGWLKNALTFCDGPAGRCPAFQGTVDSASGMVKELACTDCHTCGSKTISWTRDCPRGHFTRLSVANLRKTAIQIGTSTASN